MTLPQSVKVVEVGPRDGLQSEEQVIAVEVKVELIERLAAAGFTTIEAGSFVSPDKVPQMADSDLVLEKIKRMRGVSYPVLVPNVQGLKRAMQAKVDTIAVFTAASETFAAKNINCSINESLERFKPVIATAKENDIKVRGYVSCALGCPYEGNVKPDAVAKVVASLYEMGCYEISLGDTIGIGTPLAVIKVLQQCLEQAPAQNLAVHFHDTYGQAIANIYVALEHGISIVDSSIAGLGGCPYAKGATGNVATEDVLYLLHGLGIATGIDLGLVVTASDYITKKINRPNYSRVAQALLAKNPSLEWQ